MKYTAFFLSLLIVGCSAMTDEQNVEQPQKVEINASSNINKMEQPSQQIVSAPKSNYYNDELVKNVNHYAKWLSQDLFSNIDFPDNQDSFIVTNFALLDSNLNKTSHFGRQMTEAMIHEVHRTGFSVIDLKASGFLRMTETGDVFYQSADHLELSQDINASHVITGTLTKHQGGYIVNAKVVSLSTKALMSSAHIFVPHEVVDAVLLEEKKIQAQEKSTPKMPAPAAKKTGLPLKAYSG